MRDILVTNSLSGKKELLVPGVPGKLTMYSCGPTVYGFIHIGNLRAALVADLFFRYFKHVGYDVTYVRNYTDVDDKIIKRAGEESVSAEDIARKYTQEVELDFRVAGLLEPSHKTRATDHIAEMIALSEKLIQRGNAYVVDGEVLFSVKSFNDYGKLSGKNIDDLVSGIRVEVDAKKHSPLDFALWKPAKPGEPTWDSPWGKGRPGWHIECSAMATKWLGEQIDIHHGATDLIFPHHENEIAQSEGATGKAPFVRYWVHNAFLTMSKEKMSKSLGNVLKAREFLTQFSGEFARYLLLSVHYRSLLDFNEEAIEQTLAGLQRIYEAKQKAVAITAHKAAMPHLRAENLWGEFVASCEKARAEIEDAYANDLNTPAVLAALFLLIREFNRVCDEKDSTHTPAAVLGANALISILENEVGNVLGFGLLAPEKGLGDLARIRQNRSLMKGESRPSEDEIASLIVERAQARAAKDFARADAIRKDLVARGVELKDQDGKTVWSYR